ncbi:MAG: T9SS type A sorting domain-containing protein [Candidatus Competibacteraceae bacterium]|nr:T9SS type A sorting domain-containing protein [Candidatus Competibacteraceae bacterium]
MKRSLLITSTLLFIHYLSYVVSAQCPGAPNPSCINTMGPCGVLNDGVVGQYYNDTISFWAPKRVDASQQSGGLFDSLDFVEFKVLNVTGLPTGITWNCHVPSCTYNPQPNGTLASINFCGTPITQGTYTVSITIKGTVSTPIGNQSQNQVYTLPLNITLGSGSNAGFSFNPSQACDSAWVSFSPLLNFPLPQVTQWAWDFGGGNTYSGQTPPPQLFSSPGSYPVTCTTNVYNLKLTSININVCGFTWWCGDIEELNCGNGNADLVPTFSTGTNNWTGNEISDNCNPTWNGINYILTGTAFSISMVEIDVISANDIPPVYTGSVNGPGTYSFTYPNYYNGTFQISLSLANQIIVTDTVHIYQTPAIDTIASTLSALCNYESTTLSITPGMMYEWTLNDTAVVQTGTAHTYTTSQPGSYTVRIIDPISGCSVLSPPAIVTALTNIPPGFPNVGISMNGSTITTALTGNYTYQWLYYDGIQYSTIPAPEGTQASYTPSFNGTYCLVATNSFGCYDTSNCVSFYLSTEENPFDANHVVVFPNPTDGIINLTMDYVNDDINIRIINITGQVVSTIQILNPKGYLNQVIDLSMLSKGMYWIELESSGFRRTEKVILH